MAAQTMTLGPTHRFTRFSLSQRLLYSISSICSEALEPFFITEHDLGPPLQSPTTIAEEITDGSGDTGLWCVPMVWAVDLVEAEPVTNSKLCVLSLQGGLYSLRAQNLLGPDGLVWFSWTDSDFYSLKSSSMMIRPQDFRARRSP
ncbi:hypothetical protein WMY93_019046 [Mugilogobius chulae]|uniref:Uncharacterized protein n=1 Tax=Mugilogobius chulae TaxID=88201 RepID=A0AAW0NEF9_9GOBI